MKNSTHATRCNELNQSPIIGGFESVRLIREHKPIHASDEDGHALTFGEYIDSQINASLEDGDELQNLTIHIAPETWLAMRDAHERASRPFG